MSSEMVAGRAVTVPNVKQDCEGGCGVLVWPEERFCPPCRQLNHLLELRRLGTVRERSAATAREYARHGMGISAQLQRATASDDAPLAIELSRLTWTERAQVAGMLLAMSGAAGLALFGLIEIGRLALAWYFGVGEWT